MEVLSLEAGGGISVTDLTVDGERRGGLNICPLSIVCVCVCVCARMVQYAPPAKWGVYSSSLYEYQQIKVVYNISCTRLLYLSIYWYLLSKRKVLHGCSHFECLFSVFSQTAAPFCSSFSTRPWLLLKSNFVLPDGWCPVLCFVLAFLL